MANAHQELASAAAHAMIAVTGASGYVGGRIVSHLRAAGEQPIALVRRLPPIHSAPILPRAATPWASRSTPRPWTGSRRSSTPRGTSLSARAAVREVNVQGSLPLLDAVARAGGTVVLISSLAAFAGARSLYGQAKLELEGAVLERGGVVLRPGVVFGADAGGLFGAFAADRVGPFVRAARRRRLPAAVRDSRRRLCELIAAIGERACGAVARCSRPTSGPRRCARSRCNSPRPGRAPDSARARALSARLPRPAPAGERRAFARLSQRQPALARQPDAPRPVAALERSPVEFPPLACELWRDAGR